MTDNKAPRNVSPRHGTSCCFVDISVRKNLSPYDAYLEVKDLCKANNYFNRTRYTKHEHYYGACMESKIQDFIKRKTCVNLI